MTAAVLLVVGLGAIVMTRTAPPAYGSMVSRAVGISTSDRQALASSNHIDLPAGTTASIELPRVATIDLVGPATLELDRVQGQWKATLLAGQMTVKVADGSSLTVAWQRGAEVLGGGAHGVSEQGIVGEWLGAQATDESSPAELMDRAFGAFHMLPSTPERRSQEMAKTADLLRQAINHPQATADQKSQAEFYLAAALSNLGRHEEAAAVAEHWLAANPDDINDTILNILGDANWQLGHRDEARAVWGRLLERSPDSPYKPHFEHFLDESLSPAGDRPEAPEPTTQTGQQPPPTVAATDAPAAQPAGAYLVVTVGLNPDDPQHALFQKVAGEIAAFHRATIVESSATDLTALREGIRRLNPENVLLVIPPERLDVNFHRRVLTMAQSIDDDCFVDFAFGYFTARDGDALADFWRRTMALHEQGLTNKTWIEASVVGGGTPSYTNGTEGLSPAVQAAGFQGSAIHWGLADADPQVMEFVDQHLPMLETASVISMWGNGDPQGIWLFNDARNADPAQHWPYDPAKVGGASDEGLTRITAERFARLHLASPIVWSGTCHSGATCRVFVEPDIVSTFGASDRVELYELTPDQSLCLAMIDAGAGALLVPIASNHGWSAMNEIAFALEHDASLGEAIKSTYDDICFQAGERTQWKLVQAGDRIDYTDEHIMRAGGANRILIGDPALRLFSAVPIQGEITSVQSTADEFVVTIDWDDGFHPGEWNLYGEPTEPTRIGTRIEWPAGMAVAPNTGQLTVQVEDAAGRAHTHRAQTAVEQYRGRMYLHIQAVSDDQDLRGKARRATFRWKW